MSDKPRLIERAFPLKQASLASVHEKNVRHGHISTLHIWPARRPLAACRAALLATLLPDPDTAEERRKLCERIGGTVVQKIERKKMPNGRIVERVKEETKGGVLNWIGTKPKSGGRKKIDQHRSNVEFRNSELAWFREEIKKAYDGRMPRVHDPFAGGGAIPLEAMRLGCEATAVDINPVAWFILKCTLEYPQKLAGKTHPLPDFIVEDEDFMETFYKAHPHLVGRTKKTKRQKTEPQRGIWDKEDSGRIPKADLAWHVRAWGRWVLNHARKELAPFYPTYADFEPIDFNNPNPYEKQPTRLVPLKDDGKPDVDALNAEFSENYLKEKRNPRWVAKPAVAYLWGRAVRCKNCRALVPILKTTWLCRKDKKRVRLIVTPSNDDTSVKFEIENNVPLHGGNAAQRRENDKNLGAGTMSKSGAQCTCCSAIMTKVDIQIIGRKGEIKDILTAVVVSGQQGKEYRLPTDVEKESVVKAMASAKNFFEEIPYGMPKESIINDAKGNAWCSLYGVNQFYKLYNGRQIAALAALSYYIRSAYSNMRNQSLQDELSDSIIGLLALSVGRLADFCSTCVTWTPGGEFLGHTFVRWALPFVWDYCEGTPLGTTSGNFLGAIEWIAKATEHTLEASRLSPEPKVIWGSATKQVYDKQMDLIVTDPPYYDAVGYSVLMDYFYIWHRRILNGIIQDAESIYNQELSPKWDHEANDGELVDDASRFNNDKALSKKIYEDGMYQAFRRCYDSLADKGRLVLVFAHKHPDAWETLVSAVVRAGFVADGSWPIQTERTARTRSQSSAALSSSVWLVCKKRALTARPGWDNKVLEEMRVNITERLRDYWDAGIRGPDFVWAATGPALEAYSKHPIVKKANTPGEVMSVGEFLSHVRRMVVDFVVGQVLTGEKGGADMAAADRMDAPTAYYLLHRHDFGLEEASAGACILYSTACGLSDRDLESAWDLVSHKGTSGKRQEEDEDPDPDAESESEDNSGTGSKIKLKTWAQRKRRAMGFEAPSGRPIPLIDRVHRLMHLWRAGDVQKVDEYLDDNGLRRQELFKRLVQSLIELSNSGSDERSILESLSNHVQAKGATILDAQKKFNFVDNDIAK